MTIQQAEPTAQQVKNSSLASVSRVAGLAGWTILPVLGSIVAVITGRLAKNEIRESMGRLGGENLATAGLVLGFAGLVLAAVLCALGFLALLLFFPIRQVVG